MVDLVEHLWADCSSLLQSPGRWTWSSLLFYHPALPHLLQVQAHFLLRFPRYAPAPAVASRSSPWAAIAWTWKGCEGVWGSIFEAPGRVEDKASVLLDLINNNNNDDNDNTKQECLTWSNLLDIPTRKEFVGRPSHSKGSSCSVSRVALTHFSPTSLKQGISNENLCKQHCRRSPICDAMEFNKASTIWECHL